MRIFKAYKITWNKKLQNIMNR